MARLAFVTRAIDEAGNAVGGSPVQVRIYDDFGATSASVVTADAAGAVTITQPITPNAGTQTTLATTTAVGDTTLTVAATTGFAVGQLIPIYDGTNTRYRWITAILAGPPRLTIESAIGVIFSNTNTSIGNPDMQGVIGGYVDDTTYHYLQTTDVASTRVMPPTLIPTKIGTSSLGVQEEGVAAGTRATLNFISPFITAADNAPSVRVDVTGPTAGVAPTTSAVADAAAEGTNTTIARSDHRHGREAFATPVSTGSANAAGSATTIPRSDHVHATPLTTASAKLGVDVTLTPVNTYVDGPSVSLAAGTWLVTAYATITSSGSAGITTMKLWDGTTVFASCEGATHTALTGSYGPLTCSAIITLGSTTTVKISAAVSTNAGDIMKAAAPDNGAGNNATGIVAVRVA